MTAVDIRTMVDEMTLEEQISLLAGANNWRTVAISRLGIPSVKITYGPNGARGAGAFSSGVKAASYPVGNSLASTWDVDLVGQVAQALAEEARTKGGRVLTSCNSTPGDPKSNPPRPIKELNGFTKLELQPGETGTATFAFDMRSLAYFDDLRDSWIADAGRFHVLIGSSSSDIRATAMFELTGEWAESTQDAWRSTHV